MCLLKCIFFAYNYRISNGWNLDAGNIWTVATLSLIFDAFIVCLVNVPLFIFLTGGTKFLHSSIVRNSLSLLTALANAFVILLNTVDIFYFPFHRQRADADLLYVLRNPFANSSTPALLTAVGIIIFCALLSWWLYKAVLRLVSHAYSSRRQMLPYLIPILFVGIFVLTGAKKLIPTYALTRIDAAQLPLAQNSFHSFLYSVYRRNDLRLPRNNYMPDSEQKKLFSITKTNATISPPKNIVLFIMESVPAEFFDSTSPHKVYMPFLDSISQNSTYFTNAFSYSYQSNKGITAILAGLPTVIDIPLYHSNFTAINKTAVGTVLAKKGYNSSFFIGDNYDDFGFAKCCKWLGIDQYYCMQDIPGYKKKEKHSLGLHDEYVMDFMQEKLAGFKEPFFSVQYNISTHYPNELPASFKTAHPQNKTAQQKTMQYYNECLQKFFQRAATQPWYNNTVFFFCSDHWVQPFSAKGRIHEVNSFRIPLFIYEPGKHGKRMASPVSQLDVLNTVLSYAGVKDSIISYGQNLMEAGQVNRTVFTKMNDAIYQAINNEFVLGYDAVSSKAVYCYRYVSDPSLRTNLVNEAGNATIQSMTLQMKAFLQTASIHYRK